MIYVFKTSVKSKKDSYKLKPFLDELRPLIKWNFDLEDCDKILRVDSNIKITSTIISLLRNIGFDCEELT